MNMHHVSLRNTWKDSSSPVIYSVFARIRIEQELNDLLANPIESISCGPVTSSDVLHWSATFIGPKHTPYSNGTYHLLLDFPNSYPIRGPSVRYDYKLCKCYHKNVDASGNIVPMLNDQKWWHAKMCIKDLLIKIRNMLQNDDLNRIIDMPQKISMRRNCNTNNLRKCFSKNIFLSRRRNSHNNINNGIDLMNHIITACLFNYKYCNGSPVPLWLLLLKCGDNNNNSNKNIQIINVTKNKHENDIQNIKQLFYSNTTFCTEIIDIIVHYYGNQWYCGKMWMEFENYNPLTDYIKQQCNKLQI